ncbi:MAG: thioredoxin [Candidatus Abyssobacteria bacterium SURF_17]|uniref:Thioredoxin n=1 Tax=Candidatus Abyssobacteria bacterium SURF_17 TaxID=2093361 RepID=A0A419ESY4_9BACT|nr:MAG: thioredoxin [Candidatus Abyssubacteria bacterium SURF_17]
MGETRYVRCNGCGTLNRFDEGRSEQAVCGNCKSQLDSSLATYDRPQPLSDATFAQEVSQAKVPVLVDFFATWCGACRSVEMSLDAIASRYKGKLKVGKLDVEQNPLAARKYRIRATPTLIVFRDGRLAEQVVGALPENELEALVKKHVE